MDSSNTAWPDKCWLGKDHLTRLVASLMAAEIAAARGQDMQRLRPDLWDGATGFIDTGLALDSLERMNCAGALNQFFHLSEFGAEDYLLAGETLADWVYIVALSLASGSKHLTFQTSGSTGTPKPCTHSIDQLQMEVAFWAERFADRRHIATMVPPHHIYGFLFTVLLPQALGIPVTDLRHSGAATAKATLETPGCLAVGGPMQWQYLARSFLRFPEGIHGVTSTAPMPEQLEMQLSSQGLATLTHVYGSSETAGVGYRLSGDPAYTLLPYWAFEAVDGDTALVHRQSGTRQDLMDSIEPQSQRTFVVQGRKDGAIQIGGLNVFPKRTEDMLRDQPGVAECSVTLCQSSQRLLADITPADAMTDVSKLENTLREVCTTTLKTVERPTRYIFSAAQALSKAI